MSDSNKLVYLIKIKNKFLINFMSFFLLKFGDFSLFKFIQSNIENIYKLIKIYLFLFINKKIFS